MTTRYYDLISASVEIDASELNTKLDEITERIDGLDSMDEDAVTDLIRNTLSNEGLDAADFAASDDLESLDNRVGGMDERLQTLEEAGTATDEFERRITALEGDGNLAERYEALLARVERLENASSTANSFFALAGKMVALLLNGRAS
jgi:hypothetical protein